MFFNEPIYYYRLIREKFPNSYLVEDKNQTIIGLDCEYVSSEEYDFGGLRTYFSSCSHEAPFGGLFGILSYDGVRYFEDIPKANSWQYTFPNFFYANAKVYIHYDKISKIYTFYGDKKYYNDLLNLKEKDEAKKEYTYSIETNLDEEKKHFFGMVEKAKEYLKNGDIFQVVLSEQLKLKSNYDSLEFYEALKTSNPSPYMFHFPTPYGDVVGSSPELIVVIKEGNIFVAPIAGTRMRGKDRNEDEALKNDLLSDEKELSEHGMLVDLARNDVSKFAKSKSVQVKKQMEVVFYEYVMHISSEVHGKIDDGVSSFDVIASCFPAGTLSGAPKIRAMEIINELESFKRNTYGGGLGFLHFNGDVQQAILIRSAIFTPQDEVYIQAGAGIVYDSDREKEYEEICNKRASVLNLFKKNCKESKK